MANSQAITTSFKQDLLNGLHAFGTTVARAGTGADTFSAALYLATASISAATTAYTATGEVSGAGYTAGGVTVTNAVPPATSGTSALWTPSANFTWTNVTIGTGGPGPFNCLLVYNSTQSNRSVASYVFGSQSVTAGNFTLTQPANTVGNALVQLN